MPENSSKEDAKKKLRAWFLNSLMRRPCTEQEAQKRLDVKCNEPSLVDALMAEARMLRLLDDIAYARLFVAGHGTWGNERIMWELRQRGVSSENIATAIEDTDETERARELAKTWQAGGLETRKIESRLQRRGFSSRAIRVACHGDNDISW